MTLLLKIKTQTHNQQHENGMASFIVTLIVLGIGLIIVLSIAFLVTTQQKITTNICNSSQAYFTAEAGVEDAMLRVRKDMIIPNGNYNVPINNDQAIVTISDSIGGSRTIASQGQKNNLWRKVQAVNALSGDNVQFFFGAQVGDVGLTMNNGSQVLGNIFSNGDITGSGTITGDVSISGNHKIQGILVKKNASNLGGNVQAYNCNNSTIRGIFYYPPGGSPDNCTIDGGSQAITEPIAPEDMPITAAQINNWKTEAEAGGIFVGNYTLGNNQVKTLGPLKIQGDLIFSNNNVLTLTGTIWVTGKVQTENNTIIKLDASGYGANSGILVADGLITLSNNSTVQGSGQAGSYLMLLTTSPANPAMTISNNSQTGIFYASQGVINMANNSSVKEVTGYGLNLSNNVLVQYEIGLANLFFTSGPGAGWKLVSWQEIP